MTLHARMVEEQPALSALIGQAEHRYVVRTSLLVHSPIDSLTPAEHAAVADGWAHVRVIVAGRSRQLLWKGPAVWTNGVVIILHGGGGTYTNFAMNEHVGTLPEYQFTQLAIASGYGVVIPDSTTDVTDDAGNFVGKIWDAEKIAGRDSVDLPFMLAILDDVLPDIRPATSSANTFMVGHSSGGFMTFRTATNYGDRLTAFALVSAGDPYGTRRDGTVHFEGERDNVKGIQVSLEPDPDREIGGLNAAGVWPGTHAQEKVWDEPTVKPPFKFFVEVNDGVLDVSVAVWARDALEDEGYTLTASVSLSDTPRHANWHYWQSGYNQPMIDWFDTF